MKYNKGFAPLILLAIIVGALVIGGGAYYIGKNNGKDKQVIENLNDKNQVEVQNNEQVKNQDNTPTEKTSVKTYKNINAEYSVNYPTNWQLWPTNNSDTNFFSSFGIKNNDLSSIVISVSFGLPFDQNKNYSIYSTIDEYIKDYKVSGTPKESVQGYLNKVSSMNIGGKLLRVQSEKAVDGPNGSVNDSYLFIYNGKSYAIGFDSVNRVQYNIDHKVFVDFLNSFILNQKNILTLTQPQAETLVHKTWSDCSQGDCGGVTVTVTQNSNNQYVVTAIFTELDDSTSQTKRVSIASYQNGTWTLGQPTITRTCSRGNADGTTGWTTGLCI